MELALKQALKKYFGHSSFRPYQKEAIQEILKGRDALIIMATGSGKSLCYQLPPLITRKTAVVISPLISLMQHQVMSLQQQGIKAQHLSGAQASHHTIISNAEKGEFDIIYMTPERACSISNRFWSKIREKGVSLLAIDEAHCISEWGHDFREEYKQLDKLRLFLPYVPFVALTATATKKVQLDIMQSVDLINPYTITGSFDRPNLYYGVRIFSRTTAFREELAREIQKDVKGGGSTIVYCPTIKDAEEVSESLRHAGIEAGLYHGEMLGKDRESVHRSFVKYELQVMVATVAFGMGIDKPNVRCVIHYGCPKSLESYYQESGRCGRDGLPSKCWLYYTRGDFGRAEFYTSVARTGDRRKSVMESFIAVQRYCNTTTCRRKYILEYFGEEVASDNCGNCDNCTNSAVVKQRDMGKEVYLFLSCINSCGGRWGFNVPIEVLRGAHNMKVTKNRFDELPFHGMGKDYSTNWWKALGDQLIDFGYLNETVNDKFRKISVSSQGQHFLELACNLNRASLVLPVNHEMFTEENQKSGLKTGKINGDLESLTTLKDQGFSETEEKLYNMLLRFRAGLAPNEFTASYVICSEKTLQKLAKIRPSTMDRLGNIDGINQQLIMRHGDHILRTVKHLSESLDLHLDGDFSLQPSVSRLSTGNKEYKATYGSVENWRMWQEGGFSLSQIANLAERPSPIKEDTVVGDVVAAARLGHEVNWLRLFKETGYTHKTAKEIQVAIDKLSHTHISIFLGMEDLGLSFDEIASMQQSEDDVIFLKDSPLVSQASSKRITFCPTEDDLFKAPNPSSPRIYARETICRQKTYARDMFSECENSIEEHRSQLDSQRLQVKKDALLSWLSKCDGASISQVADHFCGSSKVFIVNMLLQLEGVGLIYNKNGIYKTNDFYTERFNCWE